jgi:hypothetical protein
MKSWNYDILLQLQVESGEGWHTFEGACVLVDEPVCVIGYFSQRENGFISDTTIYRGTPETVLGSLRIHPNDWLFGVGFFALGAAGIWLLLFT